MNKSTVHAIVLFAESLQTHLESCRKQVILLAAMLSALAPAMADTFCWTNARGDGDWTKPGNFAVGSTADGEVATVAPGSADTVYVPANTTVTLDYDTTDTAKTASCEAFAAVKRIVPDEGAVIDITVPDGDTLALSCAIAHGTATDDATCGEIVKRGTGELDLNACGAVKSGSDCYDYFCAIDVEAGVVKLPQTSVGGSFHVGTTTVGADGTLFTANTGSSNSTELYGLFGSGVVTNDCATKCRMQVTSYGEFAGRLTGQVYYYSSGWLVLTGEESTAIGSDGNFVVYQNYGRGVASDTYGSVWVKKFGRKKVDGVRTSSSIGYAETLLTRDKGGAIMYIGTGETTDKDLRLWPQTSDYPTYLDGGPHGGLVWTGLWAQRNQEVRYLTPMMLRLVLQGSNTQECVMSGTIQNILKNGTNYTFCITKQGTGTWRMAHNDDSDMRGMWRIINGTLRYDTIAEAGVNSALGKSSVLYANKVDLVRDENKVDYAFWLGGGSGGNRADLEYVGETNCVSTTRRFAVNGTGGVLNNGVGGFLRLSDFVATNTASTLVLGGSNTLDNVADCIADGGNAKMSVVKEDSGTWRLGTNCTFTGSLDVKGGRLVVGNPSCWNYYRWVIRATYSTTTGSGAERAIGLRSFGLFDADGNDRIYCLSHDGDWYSTSDKQYYRSYAYSYVDEAFGGSGKVLEIDEGHFRITRYSGQYNTFTTGGHAAVSNLFAHVDYSPNLFYSRQPNQGPPLYTNSDRWFAFTMRPVKGAPITSWDYVNGYYNQPYQMISNCLLEASVDGRAWTKLAEVTNNTKPTRNTWQSDNTTAYVAGYTTHTTGMPIPPGPTNDVVFAASSVSVADGAELVANAPEKPMIRRLVVDAAAGGGTLDGFALAPDMALEIVNADGNNVTAPMTFRNVSGLDDTSGWALTVNGKAKPTSRLTASASGFAVSSPGICIVIF